MRVNSVNLSRLVICAFMLCVAWTNSLPAQQHTPGVQYQFSQEAAQPLAQLDDSTTALTPQPVVANLSDTPPMGELDSSSTENQCGCQTCEPKPADKPKPNPCATSHKPLFFDNDFSYLQDCDYCGSCFGDCLKGHKIGPCGNLDIGGQLRFRYHNEQGMGQQAGFTRFEDTQNEFLLDRLRLYADWKVNNRLRFFVEGIQADVLTSNDEYIPRGIDRNYGDLLNLFADVKVSDSTTVRIGRQELLYGAQRLVSPLDWSNVRRKFDGIRTISKWEKFQFDAFYTQFTPVSRGEFDSPNEDLVFYGGYGTYKGWENKTLDLYILGLMNNSGVTGVEDFVTFGSRLYGTTSSKLIYETEAMAQTGRRDDTGEAISAYAYTVGLGYQFESICWKPTLWGLYDFASGNGPGDKFNRFNDLYPLGHKYLGFIDAVKRANIQSPNARLTMSPSKKLSLLFWYYNFQADEATDNVLSLGGTPDQDPNRSNFGNELDLTATYKLSARSSVLGGYSHFWRGGKIIGDTDADFYYLQWTTNF